MKLKIGLLLTICLQASFAESQLFLSNVIKSLSSDPIQIVHSNNFINANEIELNSPIKNIDELSQYLNSISYQLLEIKKSIYLIKPIQTKFVITLDLFY